MKTVIILLFCLSNLFADEQENALLKRPSHEDVKRFGTRIENFLFIKDSEFYLRDKAKINEGISARFTLRTEWRATYSIELLIGEKKGQSIQLLWKLGSRI